MIDPEHLLACRHAKLELENARLRVTWAEDKLERARGQLSEFKAQAEAAYQSFSSLLVRTNRS